MIAPEEYIRYSPNLLKTEACERILAEYAEDPRWSSALTWEEEQNSSRRCNIISISHPEIIGESANRSEIDAIVHDVVSVAVTMYREVFPFLHVVKDEGYDLLRYVPGSYYKEHVDSGPNSLRTLSVIINLTPGETYSGGDLVFQQGPQMHLGVGDVIVFPSSFSYPHQITPVLSGERHSIVTWLS